MNRVFKIQIIQPNFDKLYEKYEQMSVSNQKKESGPVAIKVSGKLSRSKIDNNISIGTRLLEADEIEDSSIRGNKTFLLRPKGNPFNKENKQEKEDFWSKTLWPFIVSIVKFILIIAAGLLVAYLVYKFGWNQ